MLIADLDVEVVMAGGSDSVGGFPCGVVIGVVVAIW